MIRTLPVAAEMLNLVAAGPCEPVMVWEDQGGRRTLTDRQETDPDTGELVWTAYLMCSVGDRPEILQVRTSAPQALALTLFGPVAVDSLAVNVRVDKSGKLAGMAGYWSARGVRDGAQPGRRNGSTSSPEPAPLAA